MANELPCELQHHWSGWPGAFCLKCGCEDPWEIALADGLWEPDEENQTIKWLGTPEQEAELKAKSICPVKGVLFWSGASGKWILETGEPIMQTALEYLQILGLPVKDRVTGFEGVVSSVGFDLYGCVQCVVTPKVATADSAPKLNDSHWFDYKRLDITNGQPVMARPAFAQMPAAMTMEEARAEEKQPEPGPEAKPSISTRA